MTTPLTTPVIKSLGASQEAMSTASIREGTPSDQSAIRDLLVEVFHETFGSGDAEATLAERLRRRPERWVNILLVAEIDGIPGRNRKRTTMDLTLPSAPAEKSFQAFTGKGIA